MSKPIRQPNIGSSWRRWNYFLGGVGIYMGTIVMEGAAMSLESKARTLLANPA